MGRLIFSWLLLVAIGCSSDIDAPKFTEIDGYPSVRMPVRAEDFPGQWPYNSDQATIEVNALGSCFIEIDGTVYGLNGLALNGGYPAAMPPVRRRIPWDRDRYDEDPRALVDQQPVLDHALRLFNQVEAQLRAHVPNL